MTFNIDKTLFLDTFYIGEIEAWKDISYGSFTNRDIIVNGLPPKSLQKKTIIIVNLSIAENKDELLAWLRANSRSICMGECYPYIERLHLIDENGGNDETVRQAPNTDSQILQGEDFMTRLGISNFLTNADERYKKYVILDFRQGARDYRISSLPADILHNDLSAYSFPFFQSILECNGLQDFKYCEFKFAYVDIKMENNTMQKTVAFMIRFPNSNVAYYDYSHNPAAAISGTNLESSLDSLKLLSLF